MTQNNTILNITGFIVITSNIQLSYKIDIRPTVIIPQIVIQVLSNVVLTLGYYKSAVIVSLIL